MTFRVVVTDNQGLHKVMHIVAKNILEAGTIAQNTYKESLEKEVNEKGDKQDV